MDIILTYATVKQVNEAAGWICGLMVAMLVMRLIRDLYGAYSDEDAGFKPALKKGGKRIAACIIGIGAAGIVAFLRRYF